MNVWHRPIRDVVLSLQLQQSLREKLSGENEKISRLKDDLSAANRRHANAEDELATLRSVMHTADNELLTKTMSLDQALRVGLTTFLLTLYVTGM